jgi:hypothetical protein
MSFWKNTASTRWISDRSEGKTLHPIFCLFKPCFPDPAFFPEGKTLHPIPEIALPEKQKKLHMYNNIMMLYSFLPTWYVPCSVLIRFEKQDPRRERG